MNSTMKWIAGATLLVFVGTTACGGSGPARRKVGEILNRQREGLSEANEDADS